MEPNNVGAGSAGEPAMPAGIGRSFELTTTTWRVPYFARILLDSYGRPSSLGTQIGDTAIPAVLR